MISMYNPKPSSLLTLIWTKNGKIDVILKALGWGSKDRKSKDGIDGLNQEIKSRDQIKRLNQEIKSRDRIKRSNQEIETRD